MLCVWAVLCCVSLINAFFRFVKGLEPQDRHLKMYCYYYYYYRRKRKGCRTKGTMRVSVRHTSCTSLIEYGVVGVAGGEFSSTKKWKVSRV